MLFVFIIWWQVLLWFLCYLLDNNTSKCLLFNFSVSAIIGPASQSYAQVIIRSNDNANGALELSPLSTSVSESSGSAGIGVNVVRKGGSFGQVRI